MEKHVPDRDAKESLRALLLAAGASFFVPVVRTETKGTL
jgi:hypothetical protein